MRYEGTVYRPPSEAGSLIIQATLSCPHNRCAFCGMYKDRKFRKRPREEVIEDLDLAPARYGPDAVRTIFLADANTAVLPTETLVTIGVAAHQRFPGLERIPASGSAMFLEKTSEQEWRRVAAAGITRIHSGLESGEEKIVESDDVVDLGLKRAVDAKLDGDQLEQIERPDPGSVQHQGRLCLGRDLVEGRAQERGLPGAHFTGQQDEPLASGDPVEERCQPLLVGLGEPEKSGIGGQGKRGFA